MQDRETVLTFPGLPDSPDRLSGPGSPPAPPAPHPHLAGPGGPVVRELRGPLAGAAAGGLLALLAGLILLGRWAATDWARLGPLELYGPALLVVAAGLAVIAGCSVGVLGPGNTGSPAVSMVELGTPVPKVRG